MRQLTAGARSGRAGLEQHGQSVERTGFALAGPAPAPFFAPRASHFRFERRADGRFERRPQRTDERERVLFQLRFARIRLGKRIGLQHRVAAHPGERCFAACQVTQCRQVGELARPIGCGLPCWRHPGGDFGDAIAPARTQRGLDRVTFARCADAGDPAPQAGGGCDFEQRRRLGGIFEHAPQGLVGALAESRLQSSLSVIHDAYPPSPVISATS